MKSLCNGKRLILLIIILVLVTNQLVLAGTFAPASLNIAGKDVVGLSSFQTVSEESVIPLNLSSDALKSIVPSEF